MNAMPLPTQIISLEELAQIAHSGRLRAVLDACDAPAVTDWRDALPPEQSACLFTGDAKEEFAAFAPYLIEVGPDALDTALELAAQEGGGILLISGADRETLFTHLRRFTLVLAPDGEEMYFRFYDPRVLPKFLTACADFERRDLFGPILAFGILREGKITLLLEQPGSIREAAPPRPSRNGLFQTRPAHMAAFTEEADRAFEARLADYLREEHGDLVAPFPDDILIELSRRGVARARRYGLFSEADLTAFVAIMFEIAPNFDERPYIQDVLTDRRLLPVEKMPALLQRVPPFVWEDAERHYDENAWDVVEVG